MFPVIYKTNVIAFILLFFPDLAMTSMTKLSGIRLLQKDINYVRFVIILSFASRKTLIIRVTKNSLSTVVSRYFYRPTFAVLFIFLALAVGLRLLNVKEDMHMRTFSGKRSTLALAIAAVTAMSGWVVFRRPAQQALSMIQLNRRYLLLAA
jgi:hypothetical protein